VENELENGCIAHKKLENRRFLPTMGMNGQILKLAKGN
jgi:hypothetical protein